MFVDYGRPYPSPTKSESGEMGGLGEPVFFRFLYFLEPVQIFISTSSEFYHAIVRNLHTLYINDNRHLQAPFKFLGRWRMRRLGAVIDFRGPDAIVYSSSHLKLQSLRKKG